MKGIMAFERNFRLKREASNSHTRVWREQDSEREISISERNPNRWRKRKISKCTTVRPEVCRVWGARRQDIDHTNSTKSSGRYKDVHNTNFRNSAPTKGEVYRDRLGDTLQRRVVHSRQWRPVTNNGPIFSGSQREEHYSTVKQNSGYSDRQWHCGLRHTSEGLHPGTWRLSTDTIGGRFCVRAIVGKTMQCTWLFLFVADRRNSQMFNRWESVRMWQLPDKRQYHPLNSRRPRWTLSETKKYNLLQKD